MTMRQKFNGLLFVHSDGSPLRRYQFKSILDKCLDAASLSKFRYKSN